MASLNGKWEPLTWRDKTGLIVLMFTCVAFFVALIMFGCYLTGVFREPLEKRIEKTFAWADYTYDYSEEQWCVNAVRRDAKPGEYVGGCWKTRHEADEGILLK